MVRFGRMILQHDMVSALSCFLPGWLNVETTMSTKLIRFLKFVREEAEVRTRLLGLYQAGTYAHSHMTILHTVTRLAGCICSSVVL